MRRPALMLLLIGFALFAFGNLFKVDAQTVVRVLGYPFPPFINEDHKTGLTPDLLSMLNDMQQDYTFTLNVVEPDQRYKALLSGQHDMILFEMPTWNWQDKLDMLEQSHVLLKEGEVYVAKRKPDMSPSFFKNIKDKHIAAFEGYHYKFANFNSDKAWLEANFKISLKTRQKDILNMVADEKAEVGIVTWSFLKKYYLENPNSISKFEVSPEFSQVYKLRALIRKDAALNVETFEKLINSLKEDYAFPEFLEKNAILRQWVF